MFFYGARKEFIDVNTCVFKLIIIHYSSNFNYKPKTNKIMLRLCLILSMFNVYFCRVDEECGRKCVMENDALICTDVPSCIPEGITRVVVNNASMSPVRITTSNFTGENWDKVTYFRLKDNNPNSFNRWILPGDSFVALNSLTELHINTIDSWIYPNTTVGLPKLKILDLTSCYNLGPERLLELLNGTDKMTGLNKIILSDWSKWNIEDFDVDDKLVDVLLPRNITDIDVSNTVINLLNFTSILKRMEHLKTLNLSFTRISNYYADNLQLNDLEHVKVVDISRVGLPKELIFPPMKYVLKDLNYYPPESRLRNWQLIFAFHTMNLTGVAKKGYSFEVTGQVIVPKKYHIFNKQLELKENNLNRLNVNILGSVNFTWNLEYLGLSNNNLEFLHPSMLSCSPNLRILDLSRNRMYIMHEEDPRQFGQLLSGVPALSYINLSNNNLTHVPRDFFKGSRNITTIDLSYNRLTQFTFTVSGLTNLRRIDMHANNIKTLDATSLHNLNVFQSVENGGSETRDVILTSNPISCAVCAAMPGLRWIISTQLVDITSQGLTCKDETGNQVEIDERLISAVHYICIRNIIIISATVVTTIVIMSVILVALWLYKRRRRVNQLAHRRVVIERIREANGPYEFPVFLSYSSKDGVFALDNVLPKLNDNLRIVTGIDRDRNLVCTGDENLRPGFYVHDEIDICLDKASVVIILVTENYCTSQYCGSELEKAYMKKKPVVLMFKEYVSEDLMSRTMRELYKRNVRILWVEQNGEYVLQTTWENVCTSIIDLIH